MKQYPSPRIVKPTPLQVLSYIARVASASRGPVIQAEFDVIIITYLFLRIHGDYSSSKSVSTHFRTEDFPFSCNLRVFTTTATGANLQAAKFVTLTFTSQKNGVRGKNIDHKISGNPLR